MRMNLQTREVEVIRVEIIGKEKEEKKKNVMCVGICEHWKEGQKKKKSYMHGNLWTGKEEIEK